MIFIYFWLCWGFPSGEESTCKGGATGDTGSTLELWRSLKEGVVAHSWILARGVRMDRGAWQATVHRVAESWTRLKRRHVCVAVLSLHCGTQAFSSCSKWGILCRCSAQVAHCGGFSCWRTEALGCTASSSVAHGLSSSGAQVLECSGCSSCGEWG